MRRNFFRKKLVISALIVPAWLLLCGMGLVASDKERCADGIDEITEAVKKAQADNLASTLAWTKVIGLLGAAKLHQQIEKYPKCIRKIERARAVIEDNS